MIKNFKRTYFNITKKYICPHIESTYQNICSKRYENLANIKQNAMYALWTTTFLIEHNSFQNFKIARDESLMAVEG